MTGGKSTKVWPGSRITVCMATYNGAKYVAEQIDSILAQLEPDDELLVSDDGSTDETLAILHGYASSLRIVGHERAGGIVRNFSRVLGAAKGDLILLADQDDVWLPGRVSQMREALGRYDLVFTNAWIVDSQLRPTGTTLFDQLRPGAGFLRNLLRTSSFVGCCMGFRRALLEGALPIPDSAPLHDWLLGLLASLRGHVGQIDTPLLMYRRHDANASWTGGVSLNSPLRKLQLRGQVLRALAICLWRSRRQQA